MRIDLHFSLVFCILFFFNATDVRGDDAHKTARQFVADFQRGVRFSNGDPIDGLASNRYLAPASLYVLSKELAEGTPTVREDVARQLEELGLQLDPPAANKIAVIRDRSIIKTLLVEGFAKNDAASRIAAGIVRNRCKPADLAYFNEIYLQSLHKSDGGYLYLVAKAKALQAKPLVERLAKLPAWKADENAILVVKIAQAALGNTTVEDEFLDSVGAAEKALPPAPRNRFYDVGDAKDGRELAEKLEILGLIGTRRSLGVLCSYLRSKIKTYVPNIKERSIRYYALDAIRYNFPDERVLLHPDDLTEWAAAEQFCTSNVGFVFDGPTPDIPRDNIYPTRFSSPSK